MNNKTNIRNKTIVLTLIFMSLTVQSVPLELSDEPLFLNQAVPPALAITFDDSGSMAWGFMPDTRPWWNAPSLSSPDYNLFIIIQILIIDLLFALMGLHCQILTFIMQNLMVIL